MPMPREVTEVEMTWEMVAVEMAWEMARELVEVEMVWELVWEMAAGPRTWGARRAANDAEPYEKYRRCRACGAAASWRAQAQAHQPCDRHDRHAAPCAGGLQADGGTTIVCVRPRIVGVQRRLLRRYGGWRCQGSSDQ